MSGFGDPSLFSRRIYIDQRTQSRSCECFGGFININTQFNAAFWTLRHQSRSKKMIYKARLFWLLMTYSCFITLPVLGSSRCDGESLSFPGCGIIPSTSTISNGEPASYPWMAFLFSMSLEDGNSSFCGASLISDIQLVTAAHCVRGKTTDEVAILIGNPNAEYEL